MKNLIDNNGKFASIKMYTFAYNPLRYRHALTFFDSSSGILHPASVYKTQINYQID